MHPFGYKQISRREILRETPIDGCMLVFNATNAWRLAAAKFFEVHYCDNKVGSRATVATDIRDLYIIRREA